MQQTMLVGGSSRPFLRFLLPTSTRFSPITSKITCVYIKVTKFLVNCYLSLELTSGDCQQNTLMNLEFKDSVDEQEIAETLAVYF